MSEWADADCSLSCSTVAYGGSCLAKCPANYYADSANRKCLACNGDTSIAECLCKVDHCTTCVTGDST